LIPPKANRSTPGDCDFVLYCERNLVKRHTIYKRLGDPAHVNVGETRARALEELATRLERLTDPDARAGTTFSEAWESYKARLEKKKRSNRTIADYRQKIRRALGADLWQDRAAGHTRADVERLHNRLTSKVGPYAANGVCRVGHAIHRHAALGMEVTCSIS
jgi:hypothetical protein